MSGLRRSQSNQTKIAHRCRRQRRKSAMFQRIYYTGLHMIIFGCSRSATISVYQ
jgi:hypothetical protein